MAKKSRPAPQAPTNSSAPTITATIVIIAILALVGYLVINFARQNRLLPPPAAITSPEPATTTTATPTAPLNLPTNPGATSLTSSEFLASAQAAAQNDPHLISVYEGLLPCADCPGINTVLVLQAANQTDLTSGSYIEYREYQEHDTAYVTTGTWQLSDATATGPTYVLTDNDGQQLSYYQQTTTGVTALDTTGQPITADLPLDLTKVAGSSLN